MRIRLRRSSRGSSIQRPNTTGSAGLAHGVRSADAAEDDPHADITDERLVELLDYIAGSDVNVIPPSQLIDEL